MYVYIYIQYPNFEGLRQEVFSAWVVKQPWGKNVEFIYPLWWFAVPLLWQTTTLVQSHISDDFSGKVWTIFMGPHLVICRWVQGGDVFNSFPCWFIPEGAYTRVHIRYTLQHIYLYTHFYYGIRIWYMHFCYLHIHAHVTHFFRRTWDSLRFVTKITHFFQRTWDSLRFVTKVTHVCCFTCRDDELHTHRNRQVHEAFERIVKHFAQWVHLCGGHLASKDDLIATSGRDDFLNRDKITGPQPRME